MPQVRMAGTVLKRSVWPCFHNGSSQGADERNFFIGGTKILEDVKYIAKFVPLWTCTTSNRMLERVYSVKRTYIRHLPLFVYF